MATHKINESDLPPVKSTSIAIPSLKEQAVRSTPNNQSIRPKMVKQIKEVEKKKNIEKEKSTVVTITIQLRYHTQYGQELFISGDTDLLGNGEVSKALPLQYFNDEFWFTKLEVDINKLSNKTITYNYLLRNNDGTISYDWGTDKKLDFTTIQQVEVLIIDSWNYAGYYENAFYTEPFQGVLLKANHTHVKVTVTKNATHTFKVKAPLLSKGQTLCLLGSTILLGNWDTQNPVLMSRSEGSDYYTVKLNCSKEKFPLAYKYGVYDVAKKEFVRYEEGNNRILYDAVAKNKHTYINDGFAVLPNTNWKGAGVAIPVFSLRSKNSWGVGEFADLKLLTDWSKRIGLKLIQILPINDTTATHTWLDSYPYAAISAFALHPLYLNIDKLAGDMNEKMVVAYAKEKERLNNLSDIDYDAVMKLKWELIHQLYTVQKKSVFARKEYQQYFEQNKHWLIPYGAFCYLRDEYKTSDFNKWPKYSKYNAKEITKLTDEKSKVFDAIAIHYFTQYHLHLQLKEATEYAHANGIIVKGDIAIGVYRFGADAWQQPELYHLNLQAGAPPDDFAVKGQNWGFPTYNWHKMRQDGFAWWKQRFEQMSYYFDAFRIDHILGFFRIWSIPMHAVEGIMGYFVPAIPVSAKELEERMLLQYKQRFTKPYINESVLFDVFGYDSEHVKRTYLNYDGFEQFTLKHEFNTQRKVEHYFATLEQNDFHQKIKQGLYDLISNVILFEVEGSEGNQFHFRFAISSTLSFQHLDEHVQHQLNDLYINYFFRRQDDFWMKEALQKLPALKRVTNMLICGEDLGLVPACVPDVMKQLGLLSLEIQRMPKNSATQFFNPKDAPYLSVVTPSTHDMSTIRGWWEEDRQRTQYFYNHEMGKLGSAPQFCEPWINKEIVLQHLYSPAMWSIFQLQDMLGIDGKVRRENPADERINVPANPKNYWKYRMHVSLEELLQLNEFNNELQSEIHSSGR